VGATAVVPGIGTGVTLALSGVETVAHLRENGRICVMLCSFERRPTIVRLHGTGRAVLADDPAFLRRFRAEAQAAALAHFDRADLNHDGKLTPEERQQAHQMRHEQRRPS